MTAQLNWRHCTASWGKQVAEHSLTMPDALMELAAHGDVEVRTSVADHQNTSLETVMILAQDESVDLRYAIAENHNVHADVLNVLTGDENPFVAYRARKTLQRIRSSSIVLFSIAAHETCVTHG